MRKRRTTDEDLDNLHWEDILHTMIDVIGMERFNEVLEYVLEQMRDERQRLRNFAVETHRPSH